MLYRIATEYISIRTLSMRVQCIQIATSLFCLFGIKSKPISDIKQFLTKRKEADKEFV